MYQVKVFVVCKCVWTYGNRLVTEMVSYEPRIASLHISRSRHASRLGRWLTNSMGTEYLPVVVRWRVKCQCRWLLCLYLLCKGIPNSKGISNCTYYDKGTE